MTACGKDEGSNLSPSRSKDGQSREELYREELWTEQGGTNMDRAGRNTKQRQVIDLVQNY